MMISFQTDLCPELPPVFGSKDYRELKALLCRIDEVILQGRLENVFIQSFAYRERKTEHQRKRLLQAFRCTLIRMLFQLSYRRLSRELACNHLYQKFCGLIRLDRIDVPCAKTLERYEKMASSETLRAIVAQLNHAAGLGGDESDAQPLNLVAPVELGVEYVDATVLKARVHHPVDWVLLRDAVRTLILAIVQARKYGICSRMPKAPQEYLCAMNKLCIEMTHARRTADASKKRKKTLRRMKKLVRVVENLARGHLLKLRQQGVNDQMSITMLFLFEQKFTVILDQLDAVIHQAHERIIGGRRINNEDKILSLYDPDIHVIVRGKADAEVEFGNTLFLAEQADGLIVDWHLYKEQAPTDSRMIPEHMRRMREENDIALKGMTGDRGFDSAENIRLLGDEIENNLCPRNLERLEERLQHKEFRQHQTRRAQTEARIAIIMHGFLGNPAYKWGYKNKERLCAWGILTHNLWVLARLPQQAVQAQAV